MATFFSTQLDFIFFFYGLAFILLGATCFAVAGGEGRARSWAVLGLFAFVHGASEWLDLTALVLGDTPAFAVARTVFMTVSFLLLVEFARREASRLGLNPPGQWLYIPLVILVVAGGVWGGLNTANALARYAIGLVGTMATSLVFALRAKEYLGSGKWFAICGAAGFALYGLAASVVAPSAPIWPATVLNYGSFTQLTGVPIQFVRGILACFIAFSVWAMWGQKLILEVSSQRYTTYLRKQFVWTLVAMATILVFGWTLTEFLGGIYKQNVQEEARGDIDLLASRFAGETATIEGVVKALAGSPSVLPLLVRGTREEDDRAKSVLDLNVEASGAKIGFILDTSGTVVASSDREHAALSNALNFGSSSFFEKSITGHAGYQFAFDFTNNGLNYYASFPVLDRRGAVIGVAVLKKSLDAFEADLRRFDRPYFFIDPDGIVVLTNRPNMLLRTFWPLLPEKKLALAREFGTLNGSPVMELQIVDATWVNIDGERDYVRRRFADHSQWSLVILKPTREIFASRVLGIVITLLVTIMTFVYLFGRERWIHDSVQMEKRLKLQELSNNLRFQAATDPLTGIYNRLKFDQALTSEMLRVRRYKSPLSLVLCDVDHFKGVNDSYGHQVGDKVLVQLSRFLTDHIRNIDLLARWGGEEFVLLLPGSDGQMACQTAEKLKDALQQVIFDKVGTVTCSFGIAQYAEGETAQVFISRADGALYRAKIKGRNRVELALQPSDLASVA